MSDIWIAFSGRADLRVLRMLRPGFRHCFALIRGAERWLVVDSMLHRMEVQATQCDAAFDLPQYLRARLPRGARAAPCAAAPHGGPEPFYLR